ncbi:hypothetical protein SAMN05444162_1084 [Paenibacillaceae bacterium GAS479]|nr:hypothetical protein SAMN05444162_1084 [Paenibacillaceae bacterium GAS479]
MKLGNKAAAALLIAALALPAGAVSAALPQQSEKKESAIYPEDAGKHHGEFRHRQGDEGHKRLREAHKRQMMNEAAAYFGISTKGKSEEQLIGEIRSMKTKQPEKWALFKKDMRAKRLAKLKAFAAAQGIKTEGMDERQLREELRKLHREGKLKQPVHPTAPAASMAPAASTVPEANSQP